MTFQTEIKVLIDKVIDDAKINSIIVEIANRKYIQKVKLNIIKAMELYVIGKINKDNKFVIFYLYLILPYISLFSKSPSW